MECASYSTDRCTTFRAFFSPLLISLRVTDMTDRIRANQRDPSAIYPFLFGIFRQSPTPGVFVMSGFVLVE
jgi:hypothetical protein